MLRHVAINTATQSTASSKMGFESHGADSLHLASSPRVSKGRVEVTMRGNSSTVENIYKGIDIAL